MSGRRPAFHIASTRQPGLLGPLASATAHVAVVLAVSAGPSVAERYARYDDIVPEGLTFLVPPSASPTNAVAQVRYDERAGGDGDAEGVEGDEGPASAGSGTQATPNTAATDADVDALGAGATEEFAEAFEVVDVDSVAVRDPSSAAPAYPPELMRAGIAGWAAVRFVVDSTGRVDMRTVETLGFTSIEFFLAVKEAMPRMRFRPAMVGDRPVRQLAEQMFRFEIQPADSAQRPDSARRTVARERVPLGDV
jgi:TonB family protein